MFGKPPFVYLWAAVLAFPALGSWSSPPEENGMGPGRGSHRHALFQNPSWNWNTRNCLEDSASGNSGCQTISAPLLVSRQSNPPGSPPGATTWVRVGSSRRMRSVFLAAELAAYNGL